jgi:beta-alanine degradation protein BauB
MDQDPTVTDGDLYTVVFENEKVRVIEYRDTPGTRTHEHHHGDSVMIALSDFQREITVRGHTAPVALERHQVRWVPAQDHVGHNVGTTDSHAYFIELK